MLFHIWDTNCKKYKNLQERLCKFAQAAKGENIKSLRMFLQLFKNSWDSAYVGGSHPLHPNVPKAVVSLYKLRIVDYFFPPIGEDPRKNG
ncbi:uncharacterized protein LOC119829332 [Zerene cesonia]|uniref:uncharacterized protein LOC119829332 n=1 Tax=Zerene cesonia TaxID=33412 RepID=UPI0018E59170|nr:uncharacterized protein LOC119829332 [Zerene cesonia]